MERKQISRFTGAAALLCAGLANAGFVIVDNGGAAVTTNPIPANNDFRTQLAAAGVTDFRLGGSLSLTPGALGATNAAGGPNYFIDVFRFGSANDFTNEFRFGSIQFMADRDPSWRPVYVGTQPAGSGIMDFQFCAMDVSRCMTNAQNANTTFASAQAIGMWVSQDTNTAWLLWDDSGAGPDDDYDDLVIRLTYRVPEPATFALLGLGLAGAAFVRRKRKSGTI